MYCKSTNIGHVSVSNVNIVFYSNLPPTKYCYRHWHFVPILQEVVRRLVKHVNINKKTSVTKIMYNVQDYDVFFSCFFLNSNVVRCHMWGLTFYTRGKHLHDRIISQRGKVWAHNINLTPPHFIKVSVPSPKKKDRSCICVLRVSILPLSTILTFKEYLKFLNRL
jgi:hypothetical protein